MDIKYYYHPDATPETAPLAVKAGDFVFYGGGMAVSPTKGVPAEVKPRPGFPYHGSSADKQVRYIFNLTSKILDEAGSSIKRIMKNNAYLSNPMETDDAINVRRDYFDVETPPPSTLVHIPETIHPGASIINDCTALVNKARRDRTAHLKGTAKTPLPAIGLIYGRPIYVQEVIGGGLVFTQGKGPSRGGELAPEIFSHPDFPYRDNQIKLQTEIIMEYFKALLEDEGVGLEHVVKAEIYMNHTSQLAGFDEVWSKYFPDNPPARCIYPCLLATAPEATIEIELIAVDPTGPYKKEVIYTKDAPKSLGHESQAVKAGPYLFLSGQMATDYRHGIAPEAQASQDFPFHASAIKKQVNYILKNVELICQAAGTSSKHLVRRRAMHTNLKDLPEAEESWREALGKRIPATTVFRPSDVLPVPACSVQYDLTAFVPKDW
jgi:enamine deaminase RidA (YjgF/YER057c/UK114 family)